MSIETALAGLNPSQEQAARASESNVLVLAGAGTGKTKTIIARAAYLIDQGVAPQRIQVLTFTRRSAAEIINRVERQLGQQASGLRGSTFHTFCLSLLRRHTQSFGLSEFSIIDQDDQTSIMRLLRTREIDALAKAEGKAAPQEKDPTRMVQEQLYPTAKALVSLYSFGRNTLRKFSDVVRTKAPELLEDPAMLESVKRVLQRYEAHKRERGYLDYDDILEFVARHMHASSELRERITGQLQHLLVDEMQDTNPLQWLLLEAFIGRTDLFCVGDDAQSIYGFRGADFENIHSFQARVTNSRVYTLEQNYRSTQEILDVSNWLLQESPLRYNKQLKAERGTGHMPTLHTFNGEFQEASWVRDDLLARHQGGARWNEHMILLRTSFSGRTIEGELLAAGIPYVFTGGTKLLESAHVKDVLSLMRVACNPRDDIAWMRYLTLWKGIGDVAAERIISEVSLAENLDGRVAALRRHPKLPPAATDGYEAACRNIMNPRRCLEASLEHLREQLEYNYRKDDWEVRVLDFELVRQLASRHDSTPEFIEAYILEPISSTQVEREGIEDAVSLITVHSAKGAECEVCYVVGTAPGTYPHKRALSSAAEVEEERRVLYVALTRAMDELIITRPWASSRIEQQYDDEGHEVPGYFLQEMPTELVKQEWHTQADQPGRDQKPLEPRKVNIGMNWD